MISGLGPQGPSCGLPSRSRKWPSRNGRPAAGPSDSWRKRIRVFAGRPGVSVVCPCGGWSASCLLAPAPTAQRVRLPIPRGGCGPGPPPSSGGRSGPEGRFVLSLCLLEKDREGCPRISASAPRRRDSDIGRLALGCGFGRERNAGWIGDVLPGGRRFGTGRISLRIARPGKREGRAERFAGPKALGSGRPRPVLGFAGRPGVVRLLRGA